MNFKYNTNISKLIGAGQMTQSKTSLTIILGLLLLISGQSLAATATTQQQIELQPGWNAVHVEVEPINNDIKTIFSGVPVASVWRWIPENVGKDFIQDPAEGLLSIDGWYGYFPEPRPEAFLSNLYTISANTAYLIKLDGSTAKTINLVGKPILRKVSWRSDSFTLTGLPVTPGSEPTFGEYFSQSAAHDNQPIYQLNAQGQWQLVSNPQTTAIKSGQSYWIYTKGTSKYPGLIDITLQQGDSLAYRTIFTELDFVITNFSDVPNFINIARVGGVQMPMKFLNVDPETGEEAWPNLPNNRVLELQPGEDVFIKFAVDRLNFNEENMEQVFSISNEQGARYLLHASANTIQPLTLPTRNYNQRGINQVPDSYAGLWIGTAQVQAVSEAQTAGTTPTLAGKSFPIRLLIHVDATGQARLVKSVVQMWQEGTYAVSASNPDYLEVETPGFYVLLTDDSLIPNYTGVSLRGGEAIGIRYSTIAYDFAGLDVEMNGEFALSNSLSVSLLIDSDLPTNPFYHKYHPDHDNLDAQFLNYKQEAYQVTREMQFTFLPNNPNYPDQADPPGWGYQEMGGIYREAISGIHKNSIFVEGDFRLRRVAATPVLNQ